jgi:hypothetical protein
MMAVDVIEYMANGVVQTTRYWDGVVDDKVDAAAFLFRPQPGAVAFRLAIQNVGRAPGAVIFGPISLCRQQLPRPTEESKLGSVAASWNAKELAVGRTGSGQRTSVRQVTVNGARISGDIAELYSPGFRPTWAFDIRRWLEPGRIWFERHLSSNLAQTLRWLYRLIGWLDTQAKWADYQLRIDAGSVDGNAAYNVYVQWVTTERSMDWRLAGTLYAGDAPQQVVLPVRLPANASNFELALIGRGRRLDLGPMTLERLAR